MMVGSSNGGTSVAPSRSQISRAFAMRSAVVVPSKITRAPSRSAPSRFARGAVVGITTVARAPNSLAASATAWP